MKKLFLSLLLLAAFSEFAYAQVPYYATSLGKGTNYGYFEFDFRPGVNDQTGYTYWQHGFTDWLDLGFDFEGGMDYSQVYFTVKPGYTFSKWFSIGAMIQPTFSSSDNFKFSGLLSTILLQGSITRNERLFWITNTQIGCWKDYTDYYRQQWCLGYSFELKNGDTILPMAGVSHYLTKDTEVYPYVGISYFHKRLGLYLWGNELASKNPSVSISIDFTF